MARIFLSYDHDDAAVVRPIVTAVEKAGHSVWYDRHLQGGSEFAKEIEQALAEAEAVVVLWSKESIDSPWVRDEAAVGRDAGRLIPLSLDGTEPPLGFRQFQTIQVSSGRIDRAEKSALLDAITRVAAGSGPTARKDAKRLSQPRVRHPVLLTIAAIVTLSAIGIFFWRTLAPAREVVVSLAAARGDSASRTLSSDLARQLGALQTSAILPVRVVEASDGNAKPSLTFEAAASGPTSASLTLKSGKDSSILWSSDFAQPHGNRADLLQQMGYTAARLIRCASDGLSARSPLEPATLQVYLNACAKMADLAAIEDDLPIDQLELVVQQAPKFEPGWSALLLAEAESANPARNDGIAAPGAAAALRRRIDQARRINPAMPAIAVAETALLPQHDYVGRIRRVERAVAANPDDTSLLSALASALSSVGRQSAAVEAASKAVKIDPLSPLLHSQYTTLLAYSGNFDGAKRELAKAAKLWPGTASLEDSQYRFHYRYGDAKIARAIFEKHTDSGGRAVRMLLDLRERPSASKQAEFLEYVRERLRTMENPTAGIGFALIAFATLNAVDEAFATALDWPKTEDLSSMSEVFFRPEWKEERRDPRFLLIARRIGMLDYWRSSGRWPDYCDEMGLPYDCEAEAAKLK